jgi:hypothetical protein
MTPEGKSETWKRTEKSKYIHKTYQLKSNNATTLMKLEEKQNKTNML